MLKYDDLLDFIAGRHGYLGAERQGSEEWKHWEEQKRSDEQLQKAEEEAKRNVQSWNRGPRVIIKREEEQGECDGGTEIRIEGNSDGGTEIEIESDSENEIGVVEEWSEHDSDAEIKVEGDSDDEGETWGGRDRGDDNAEEDLYGLLDAEGDEVEDEVSNGGTEIKMEIASDEDTAIVEEWNGGDGDAGQELGSDSDEKAAEDSGTDEEEEEDMVGDGQSEATHIYGCGCLLCVAQAGP